MTQQVKIPAWIAILININIIIGAGFFVVVPQISATGGILAPLTWLLCGLILLPLVIVFAKLAHIFPSAGGIYVYSLKQLGPLWGFISGWGYYIGCAAINATVIHAFCQEIQKLIILHSFFQGLWLDFVIIFFFMFLNLLNVKFLEGFQVGLSILKTIPLLTIIIAVPFLYNLHGLSTTTNNFSSFLSNIPLVFFAYIGIEACCSISDKIENGKKNASKVIYFSFILTAFIYTIAQLSLLLLSDSSSACSFFSILPRLTSNQFIIIYGNYLIHASILLSFLGGFYGMFYFNNWNLFAIAKENHIIFSSFLTKLNKNNMPWICVLFQSSLMCIFLMLFSSKENSLAIIGDFGTIIAYLLSVIAFLTLYKNIYGYLALLSSFILMYLCTQKLFSYGLNYLLPFIGIIALGILAHKIRNHANTLQSN